MTNYAIRTMPATDSSYVFLDLFTTIGLLM